ncbi:FAD dependent oxidoreductase [Plectosphaerella plurivora]|uniref:FAD dependent oxidoreductase n=1 Tax=Plectosphaerella plurivora TaxID=936078 RepID=A0A9P8V6T3_9PEZI|nr:FAD dependent oxidoreductase [Plectosphaerella plurivora]
MAPSQLQKTDSVVIVGAGIFGLSTALHLASRGYTNVTVFDRQNYDESMYSYQKGCDAASADLNKIMRSAYGGQTEYQELSFEAIRDWKAWNDEISAGNIPPGMSRDDRVFINTGVMSLNEGTELPSFERATIEGMVKHGHGDSQLSTTDAAHLQIAADKGFDMDQFRCQSRGQKVVGVMDTSGGVTIADKACRFALHKARANGARFVFGPRAGGFASLVYEGGRVAGIKTRDGLTHGARLVVMACGGWTPSLVPQLDGLCETTAGSVAVYRLPRRSAAFDRFGPDKFPVWMFKMRDGAGGGLYGFPRDDEGLLKIGYRGTKYTNPRPQADGRERSVPVTRYTEGERLAEIPVQAMNTIAKFVADFMPELAEAGYDKVAFTRLCWYNDTFDNHFVVDRVPGQEGLMVATGGSGHAFKYLPNIGRWVADVVEGVGLERPAVKAWRWRELGREATPANVLMEGNKGPRALSNVPLTSMSTGYAVPAKL